MTAPQPSLFAMPEEPALGEACAAFAPRWCSACREQTRRTWGGQQVKGYPIVGFLVEGESRRTVLRTRDGLAVWAPLAEDRLYQVLPPGTAWTPAEFCRQCNGSGCQQCSGGWAPTGAEEVTP